MVCALVISIVYLAAIAIRRCLHKSASLLSLGPAQLGLANQFWSIVPADGTRR